MIFEYQALNSKGESVSNLVDAVNQEKARQKLRSQGLFVVKIAPHTMTGSAPQEETKSNFSNVFKRIADYFGKRSSAKQVGIFSRQLSTLLGAGLPLLRAISDILEQTDHEHFKHVVADVKEKLEEGSSFSNCLSRHRLIFSNMYINMVRVGENLGSLDKVIERLADIEEKNSILKNKIQAALWYPAFMILFSILVIIFILVKIIPSISAMFIELGKDLPLPTKIVMGISSFFTTYWMFLILLIFLGMFFFRRYMQTPEGRTKIDELKLKLPIFHRIYNKLVVLRFTQNLGVLLNNNVDLLKSFEIVKKIVGNEIIEKNIAEAADKIREGTPISRALAKSSFLPKMVLGMIAAGEASDKLDAMLLKIGDVYETEIDLTITSATNMIEPIIIIIMGGVIGMLVISVMLPILEMNLIVQ